MSQPKITIPCPLCGQALRVPGGLRQLRVRCICGHTFLWPSTPLARRARRWRSSPRTLAVLGFLAAALFALVVVFRSPKSDFAPGRQSDFAPEVWVSVSYSELVNPSEITQSGETISEVRGRLAQDPSAYAQLQPFLEPWGSLLPDVQDMVQGPTAHPRRAVAEACAPGATRPAWVDLLRGGRYIVTYDGYDLVTAFAPGRKAKDAYDAAFAVLRHPLGALQASVGRPLRVETYAYENDYASFELRLNTKGHTFTATSFGPPSGKTPVDLQALEAFFDAGNELTGARIDPRDGLVLVGGPGKRSTLARHPTSVADLAVAYRAVFHAGHNDAFISLDPSPDPTRVRVNFGGVLEDTRLGSVVLQSDMRFKTLSSGLDPITHADLRGITRLRVHHFMTVSERVLATAMSSRTGWENTRFWFYPDAVEILTDLEGRTAYVEKARFTADAERSRTDFSTRDEFDASKSTRLSPSIRANIDDLNARYEDYAEVFPELRELTTVARLMSICSWLRNAHTSEVDLDGLLAAELPAWSTPRDKPQLLSVSVFPYAGTGAPSAAQVLERSGVRRIDPLLDEPIDKVFPTDKARSAFLLATGNAGGNLSGSSVVRRPSRDYIHTQEDLKAFVEVVADRIMAGAQGPLEEVPRDLRSRRARLEGMKSELDDLKGIMQTSDATHNLYLDQYNALVGQYNTEVNRQNALARGASLLETSFRAVTRIQGGIDLSPRKFKVSQRAASPELERVRAATPEGGVNGWTRSPRPSGRAAPPSVNLPWRWETAGKGEHTDVVGESGTDAAGNRFWASKAASSGDWKERIVVSGGRAVERVYDSGAKELRIAHYNQGKPETYLVAQRQASGRIVFKRRAPNSLIPIDPGAPP